MSASDTGESVPGALSSDRSSDDGADSDDRPVFVFQHGLGGDAGQSAALLPDEALFRVATLECPGHGANPHSHSPSIASFADEVAAFARREAGLEQEKDHSAPWVLGGISMGAAIAMRLACASWRDHRNNSHVPIFTRPPVALILVRPAWLFDAAPVNMAPIVEVGKALRAHGPEKGAEVFKASATYETVLAVSPDNAQSLLGQFQRPQAVGDPSAAADMLEAISNDGPGVAAETVRTFGMPVLVIGCPDDFIHPIEHARELAAIIPGCALIETASKSVEPELHAQQVRTAINEFLLSVHVNG